MARFLFQVIFFACFIYLAASFSKLLPTIEEKMPRDEEYNFRNVYARQYPNQCYRVSESKAYPIGTHNVAGRCEQVKCTRDLRIYVTICGPYTVTKPDLSQPFPECCQLPFDP